MKKEILIGFLLLTIINTNCRSSNWHKNKTIDSKEVISDKVHCSDLKEEDCIKLKDYILSNLNIYLDEKFKVECYQLVTKINSYFILIGFDKNITPMQKKIIILNSTDLMIVFNSIVYGDIITIDPTFIDLNNDGDKDIIFNFQDEEFGFIEIYLYDTGTFKYAMKSLTFPISSLLELEVSFYEIKDINSDELMEIIFPILIDDTKPNNRKTLRNVIYTLQSNEYKLLE